jgi:hypothetical protein
VGEEFESILRASKHPIGNFGRIAKFASSQFSDVVMGSGAKGGRDSSRLHAKLHEEGRMLAELTTRLARAVHKLLRTHRMEILDMQLLQERVSWSVVEMFAMAAVISKLQSMLEASGSNGSNGNGNGNGNGARSPLDHDLLVGKAFCHRVYDAINDRFDKLFDNRDNELLAVADSVLTKH